MFTFPTRSLPLLPNELPSACDPNLSLPPFSITRYVLLERKLSFIDFCMLERVSD
jgi:hypothetical protein